MIQLPATQADIDNIATWAKYNKKLCRHCGASCCSLPVEVKPSDLVRMELIDELELEEDLKFAARRLLKKHLVEHFHSKTKTFTLARMASGDCIFLDSQSRRCSIYLQRPDTCRNHPQVGPRSGYCAFRKKATN
ncbi:MAG: YkgJ family cysteine cluster protein [Desulforhopalus sp.]